MRNRIAEGFAVKWKQIAEQKLQITVSAADVDGVRILRRITEDDAIAEFIRSDFPDSKYRKFHSSLRGLVEESRPGDQCAAGQRRALLFLRHHALWQELPADTEWYEAEVTEADLGQINVFPRAHWRKLSNGNFTLRDVLQRIREQGASQDPFFTKISTLRDKLAHERNPHPGSIILIGLHESSPLTIIDGNHRLVSAALEGRMNRLKFVCGLSPNMSRCCWYKTNLPNLARYTGNLVRHMGRRPEAELNSLLES